MKGKKKNIVLSNGERTVYKCKIRLLVSDLIAQLVESFQLTPPRGKRAESGGNEEALSVEMTGRAFFCCWFVERG